MGTTKQVTYRMPMELYLKLQKIAESMFQPMPVVFRAAAAEYAKNHRPVRHKNTGLELKWPEVKDHIKMGSLEPAVGPLVEDEEEIVHTTQGVGYVTDEVTKLSDG